MKTRRLMRLTAALGVALGAAVGIALPAAAEEQKKPPTAATPATPATGETPAMSEIPVMKAQGERMATLMERLTKETDPAERKRIMAEAICPQ